MRPSVTTMRLGSYSYFLWMLFITIVSAWCASPSIALAAQGTDNGAVQISATWSTDLAHPGDEVVLAVVMDIGPNYHVGTSSELIIRKGDRGLVLPTTVALEAIGDSMSQVEIGDVNFPFPNGFLCSRRRQ